MPDYRLVVTRDEPNPTYAEEYAKWERRSNYGGGYGDGPSPIRTVQVLDVTLSEQEYQAVKRAVLEVGAPRIVMATPRPLRDRDTE